MLCFRDRLDTLLRLTPITPRRQVLMHQPAPLLLLVRMVAAACRIKLVSLSILPAGCPLLVVIYWVGHDFATGLADICVESLFYLRPLEHGALVAFVALGAALGRHCVHHGVRCKFSPGRCILVPVDQ